MYTCSCSVLNNQGHCPLAAFCNRTPILRLLYCPIGDHELLEITNALLHFIDVKPRQHVSVARDMYYKELARLLQCVHYVTGQQKQINQMHGTVLQPLLLDAQTPRNSQHRRTRGDLNMQMI